MANSEDDPAGAARGDSREAGLTFDEAREAWGPPDTVREWRALRDKGHTVDGPIGFLNPSDGNRDDPDGQRRFAELDRALTESLLRDLHAGRVMMGGFKVDLPPDMHPWDADPQDIIRMAPAQSFERPRTDIPTHLFDASLRAHVSADAAVFFRPGLRLGNGFDPPTLIAVHLSPRLWKANAAPVLLRGEPVPIGIGSQESDSPLLVHEQPAVVMSTPRQKKQSAYSVEDRNLVREMHEMVRAGTSAWQAAKIVADRARGAGFDSKVKRLYRRYSETYPAIPADNKGQ